MKKSRYKIEIIFKDEHGRIIGYQERIVKTSIPPKKGDIKVDETNPNRIEEITKVIKLPYNN